MTRINCLPPEELTGKHLLAEYRELPRVFKLARICSEAPQTYTMGTGHVKFFYDKLLYLEKRQGEIIKELKKRGVNTKFNTDGLRLLNSNEKLWNDWTPTQDAIEINRKRIEERLNKNVK